MTRKLVGAPAPLAPPHLAAAREHLSALLSFRLHAGETASEVWRSLGPFAIGYHAARLLDLGRRPADA